jgi:ABC-2 type transport system ATP-binding protein
LNGRTEEVRAGHISAVLAFAQPPGAAPMLTGAHAVTGYGSEWRVLFGGSRTELVTAAARVGARVVEERTPTLDEILVARAGGKAS